MLPEAIRPTLDGAIPGWIATASATGVPNVTVVSQVYYVDAEHVAISYQFFSKTTRNLSENPKATIQVLHPETMAIWLLEATYVRRETEGPLFERMDMHLEAIASMQGMEDVFKLRGAEIFRVTAVHELLNAQAPG